MPHRALVSSVGVAVLLAMVATAFDPLSVTSGVLSVWMDGADPLGTGVLPADGALCEWKDKSGLGNHGVAQNAGNQDTTNPTYCPDYAGSDRSVSFTTYRTAPVKRFYGVRGYSGVPEQEEIFAVFELKKYEGGYIAIVGGDGAYGREFAVNSKCNCDGPGTSRWTDSNNLYLFYDQPMGGGTSPSPCFDFSSSDGSISGYSSGRVLGQGITQDGKGSTTVDGNAFSSPSLIGYWTKYFNKCAACPNSKFGGLCDECSIGSGTSFSYYGKSYSKIGCYAGGQNPFVGKMFEVVIFNQKLSTKDRDKMVAYLQAKWAVPNVPTASPTAPLFHQIAPLPYTTGLVMWLDGMDPLGTGTTPTTDIDVPTWKDKSGFGLDATMGTYGSSDYCKSNRSPLTGRTWSDSDMYLNTWPFCEMYAPTAPTYNAEDNSINFAGTVQKSQYYETKYTSNPWQEDIFIVFEIPWDVSTWPADTTIILGTDNFARGLLAQLDSWQPPNPNYNLQTDGMSVNGRNYMSNARTSQWSDSLGHFRSNTKTLAEFAYDYPGTAPFGWGMNTAMLSVKGVTNPAYSCNWGCQSSYARSCNYEIWQEPTPDFSGASDPRTYCDASRISNMYQTAGPSGLPPAGNYLQCTGEEKNCWCGQKTWIGANPGPCHKCAQSFNPLKIYEFIAYKQPLSKTKRKLVQQYLTDKWGITNTQSSAPSPRPTDVPTLYPTTQAAADLLIWYRFEPGDISADGTKLANWASGSKVFDSTVFGSPKITSLVHHNGYNYTSKFKAFMEGTSAINFPRGNCKWDPNNANRFQDPCADAVKHYIKMPSIVIPSGGAMTMLFWFRVGEALGPVCRGSNYYNLYSRNLYSGGSGADYTKDYYMNGYATWDNFPLGNGDGIHLIGKAGVYCDQTNYARKLFAHFGQTNVENSYDGKFFFEAGPAEISPYGQYWCDPVYGPYFAAPNRVNSWTMGSPQTAGQDPYKRYQSSKRNRYGNTFDFQWHHFAYVFGDTANKLYVDGKLEDATDITFAASGAFDYNYINKDIMNMRMIGFMDDFKLYSRELSAR